MPNPLFLAVMGITFQEYMTYSNAKKARFQTIARQKLADVHESDIDAYNDLTAESVNAASKDAAQAEINAREDEENS